MTRMTARDRVALMSAAEREDLRERYGWYVDDGDNRRAALSVDDVELLLALADEGES